MSADTSFLRTERGSSTPVFHVETIHTTSTYSTASKSTTAAYGVLVLMVIYYFLYYLEAHHLPLSELLWNSLIYLTPSKMLSRLDSKFSASTSASKEPEDDDFSTAKAFDSTLHANKSNAMRRLLGLDGIGIMTVVQRTRRLSDLGSVFKSAPKTSLPGLGNWDHSCYQNSVIQGLASLECLPGFLRRAGKGEGETVEMDNDREDEGKTRKALRELTERLNDQGNVGKTLWTPGELKSMSSWQQQDAQEYFSKVMDSLEKDMAKEKKMQDARKGLEGLSSAESKTENGGREFTPQEIRMNQIPEELHSVMARNPLEGLLAQRVGCQQCGYVEGLSLVPFNCLTVPLGKRWLYDIRECLDEYTALELINGVNCAKCTLLKARAQMDQMLKRILEKEKHDEPDDYNAQLDSLQADAQKRLELLERALEDEDFSDSALKKCQVPPKNYISSTKSRQAVVARAPMALVIHINRSIFDELTGEQSKNQATVRFPKRFDLGSWCLGSQKGNAEERSMEEWNTDPRRPMLDDVPDDEVPRSDSSYELRAVVTHYGRHENGHYICYRRSPYSRKVDPLANQETRPWWRLSDEEVTEVSEETMLAQGGVFMLFYEHVPCSNSPLEPFSDEVAKTTSAIEAEEPVGAGQSNDEETTDIFSVKVQPKDTPEVEVHVAPEQSDLELENAASGSKASSIKADWPQEAINSEAVNSEGVNSETVNPTSTLKPAAQTEDTLASPTSNFTNSPASPRSEADLTKAMTSTSPTMKTVNPRTGRGNSKRTGQAMESMAGFVQAN